MNKQTAFNVIVAIVLVSLVIAVIYQDTELESRIDALEYQVRRDHAYIWDIAWELGYSSLVGGYHDEDGVSHTFYAFEGDMGPGYIDKLMEEVWGENYLYNREHILDPDNKIYEECGYTAMKPGCPNSRLDELEINHMFSLDSRSYPGNSIENITDEIDLLWQYIARHNERLQPLEYEVFHKESSDE